MMRILTWLALSAWGSAVFAGTFWAAFPSAAVASRIAYGVSTNSNGAWHVEMDSCAPWWYGLSAKHVTVSSVEDGVNSPVFQADAVGLRISPWSLLHFSPTPQFVGFVGMESAALNLSLQVAKVEKAWSVRSLNLDAANIPLTDLLGLLGLGAGTTATGGVDVAVKLDVPDGLSKADGTVSIRGNQVQIETVTSTMIGWNAMEIHAPIDDLDIELAIEDGKAKVTEGVVKSSLAELDLTGDVAFDDTMTRSKLDLAAVIKIGNWEGTPLDSYHSLVESALRSAKFADGTYHYTVEGRLGHLTFSDLRPVRDPNARSLPLPVSTPVIPGAVPASTSVGAYARPEPVRPAVEPEPEPDLNLEDPADEGFDPEEGQGDDGPLQDDEGGLNDY